MHPAPVPREAPAPAALAPWSARLSDAPAPEVLRARPLPRGFGTRSTTSRSQPRFALLLALITCLMALFTLGALALSLPRRVRRSHRT